MEVIGNESWREGMDVSESFDDETANGTEKVPFFGGEFSEPTKVKVSNLRSQTPTETVNRQSCIRL